MLEHISRNLQALAEDLENRITVQNVAEWHSGRVLDWENEAHQFARTVAYGDLSADNPAPVTAAYEQQADRAIEVQLERAGFPTHRSATTVSSRNLSRVSSRAGAKS